MKNEMLNRSGIKIGVLPTHTKFVGGLVPDDSGRLPRDSEGQIILLAEAKRLVELSPVKIDVFQISCFVGVDSDDFNELFTGVESLGLEVQTVMMLGGVNPMFQEDEEETVRQLVEGLKSAKEYGVKVVTSTSFEDWMTGKPPLSDCEYEKAVKHLGRIHAKAYELADLEGSSVECWNLEFLRSGEFTTFTSIAKAAPVVTAANELIGKPFVKLMVDAAHCGNSGLSIVENQELIKALAERDELGIYHASAKTTRGCLSTDDGWTAMLMETAAQTGKLDSVYVEVFHHEDPALVDLKTLDPGFGVDTRDGRTYTQVAVDGVVDVTRRLSNLKARGVL